MSTSSRKSWSKKAPTLLFALHRINGLRAWYQPNIHTFIVLYTEFSTRLIWLPKEIWQYLETLFLFISVTWCREITKLPNIMKKMLVRNHLFPLIHCLQNTSKFCSRTQILHKSRSKYITTNVVRSLTVSFKPVCMYLCMCLSILWFLHAAAVLWPLKGHVPPQWFQTCSVTAEAVYWLPCRSLLFHTVSWVLRALSYC